MNDLTIASLGLRVDSSHVEVANEELLQFVKAAEKAEGAAEGLGKKAKETGQQLEEAGEGAKDLGDGLQESGRRADQAGSRISSAGSKIRNSLLSIAGVDGRLRGTINLLSNFSIPAAVGIGSIGVAVATLAKAFEDGEREALGFARAIATSGNLAGVTVGQLQAMAREMDNIAGTRRGATEVLSLLVSTGKVGAENLQEFAGIAQKASKTIGVPIEEIAGNFAKLGDKPREAAIALNEALGFVTPALYDQIAALEKQGKSAEAANVLQRAYAEELLRQIQVVEPHLTKLGKGWEAVKAVAGEAWDAMAGIGVSDEVGKRLEELTKLRDEEGRELGEVNARSFTGKLQQEANDAEERRLRDFVERRNALALATAKAAASNIAYTRSQEDATAKDDAAKRAAEQLAQARLAFDIGEIQRALSGVVTEYDAMHQALEAQRDADLLSSAEYYAEKRRLIEEQVEAEAQALEAENERLRKQGGTDVERIQLQNKIAENEQRIVNLRKQAAGQLAVIANQERAELEKTAKAYEQAQAAADAYVKTLSERYRIEAEGLGLGRREREKLQERSRIEADFSDRRQRLEEQFRAGEITREFYEKQLEVEADALARSLDAYEHYYEELEKKQGDWRVGASEAVNNFLDDAKNVAGQVEAVLTRAFEGSLDSLVDFAITGKSSFGDLAKSILADLLKIELRIALSNILGPMFQGLGGAGSGTIGGFGSGGGITINGIGGPVTFGGGRAKGGPVWPGTSFDVGENGPERFFPTISGLIVPNHQLERGVTVVQHMSFGAGVNRAELALFGEQVKMETVRAVREQSARAR